MIHNANAYTNNGAVNTQGNPIAAPSRRSLNHLNYINQLSPHGSLMRKHRPVRLAVRFYVAETTLYFCMNNAGHTHYRMSEPSC